MVDRSIPASVNAWSVGAKTVNGPSPCKVATNDACVKAETRVLWSPVDAAVAAISTGPCGGINTLSMTWIMPLLVATSAPVTVASLTFTPLVKSKVKSSPFSAVAVMPLVRAEEGTLPLTT